MEMERCVTSKKKKKRERNMDTWRNTNTGVSSLRGAALRLLADRTSPITTAQLICKAGTVSMQVSTTCGVPIYIILY